MSSVASLLGCLGTLPSPNHPTWNPASTTQVGIPSYRTSVSQEMAEASFEPLVPPRGCARGRDGGSKIRPSPTSTSSCLAPSMASMAMAVCVGPTDVQVCLQEGYTKQHVHCPHGNVGGIDRSTVLLTRLFNTRWLGMRCSRNLMVTMFCRCNPNSYVAPRAHTTHKERR